MVWIAERKTVVAISTFEAEVIALSKSCIIAIHLRNLVESLKMKQEQAAVVFEDNAGPVAFSKGGKFTPRTKHIDVKSSCVYVQQSELTSIVFSQFHELTTHFALSILGIKNEGPSFESCSPIKDADGGRNGRPGPAPCGRLLADVFSAVQFNKEDG